MLRVASWPLSTLERLQLRHLRSMVNLDATTFAEHYADALRMQRAALAELTTTAAFERALALANPIVAGRWRKAGGWAPTRRARDRRLEATVVRYLCRAAGRSTPNGAWAGVTAVEASAIGPDADADRRIASCAGILSAWPAQPQLWVSPSLVPFATLCRMLGARPEFLRQGLFELEPTLHRRDGRWWFWSTQRWRVLPEHRFVDELVGWFEAYEPDRDRLILAPFVEAVKRDNTASSVWTALEGLRRVGVLRPALRLDPTAGAPGEILREVADALPEKVRTSWLAAVQELEKLSGDVASRFQQLDGAELCELLDDGISILRALWRTFDVPGEPTWPPLRVDTGAPFRAAWSEKGRARIAEALDEMVHLWRADGTAEWYRQTHAARLRSGSLLDVLWELTTVAAGHPVNGESSTSSPLTLGLITRASVAAAHFGMDRHFDVEGRWAELLVDTSTDRRHTIMVSPAQLQGPWSQQDEAAPWCGAQLITWSGGYIHFEWGRPEPGLFFGRHRPLEVGRAVAAQLDAVFAGLGFAVADVMGRDMSNIDAAVHWRTNVPLDLARRAAVRQLAIERGPDGVPYLSDRAGDRRLVPVSNSAAASAGLDPLSALLSRLVSAHGWEFLSFGFPILRTELTRRPASARVCTASHHVLSRRRLVAPSAWLQDVRRVSPAERFRAWLQFINDAILGDLVAARVGLAPPLVVPVCSPLAVEALFAWLPADTPVVFEEVRPSGLVTDGGGQEYVAELAVAWWRV